MLLAREAVAQRCGRGELVDRQGQIDDRDDTVRARRERAEPPRRVHVQAHSRAPPGAGPLIIAREGFHHDVGRDAGHAPQRLGEHTPFEFALVLEGDMAEVRTTRAIGRVPVDSCSGPDMRHPVPLASTTRTVSARQNERLRSSAILATTRSPGTASETNTTRPSCRATATPPCAMLITSSSISRPIHSPIIRA